MSCVCVCAVCCRTAAEYANLHPRVSSSELGLVMFKDLQESSIPEQYGKLNNSEPVRTYV